MIDSTPNQKIRSRTTASSGRTVLAAILVCFCFQLFSQTAHIGDCTDLSGASVYSNAQRFGDTGDVGGFELAVDARDPAAATARLFDYEGTASMNATRLTGRVAGDSISLSGTQETAVRAYPSGKEMVQSTEVRVVGKVSRLSFTGSIYIGTEENAVVLSATPKVWLCR